MDAQKLAEMITYSFLTHANYPTKPNKAVRKWDGKTPYGTHPTWCAMTLLTESELSEYLRTIGAQALLLHDILEDTTAELPAVCPEVAQLVKDMTFANSAEEMERIWEKNDVVKLLKLYDKVSNLLDGAWMHTIPGKYEHYTAYVKRLCGEVEEKFGTLNIVRLAKAICE